LLLAKESTLEAMPLLGVLQTEFAGLKLAFSSVMAEKCPYEHLKNVRTQHQRLCVHSAVNGELALDLATPDL